MVSFGNASGPVPPVNLGILSTKGSLYVTRPTLATYIASRADLEETARSLFDVVSSGKVKIETTKRYKLADAAQAHRDLEGRKTTGSIVRPVTPFSMPRMPGFAEGSHRLVVLAFLVQALAVGAQLLHLRGLAASSFAFGSASSIAFICTGQFAAKAADANIVTMNSAMRVMPFPPWWLKPCIMRLTSPSCAGALPRAARWNSPSMETTARGAAARRRPRC